MDGQKGNFNGDGCPIGTAVTAAIVASDPVHEDLGHSFVYVNISHSDEGVATSTTMFQSISGASMYFRIYVNLCS